MKNKLAERFELGFSFRTFNGGMRRRRIAKGLTQAQLGEVIGISCGRISQIELMTVKPTDNQITALAAFLECSADDIWPPWLEALRTPATGTVTSFVDHKEFSALTLSGQKELLQLPAHESAEATTETRNVIDQMLKKALTDRAYQIVRLRFGLGGTMPLSLEEIARRFGISKERVRQIISRALQKLKHDKIGFLQTAVDEDVIELDQCPSCAQYTDKFLTCNGCKKTICKDCVHRHRKCKEAARCDT